MPPHAAMIACKAPPRPVGSDPMAGCGWTERRGTSWISPLLHFAPVCVTTWTGRWARAGLRMCGLAGGRADDGMTAGRQLSGGPAGVAQGMGGPAQFGPESPRSRRGSAQAGRRPSCLTAAAHRNTDNRAEISSSSEGCGRSLGQPCNHFDRPDTAIDRI